MIIKKMHYRSSIMRHSPQPQALRRIPGTRTTRSGKENDTPEYHTDLPWDCRGRTWSPFPVLATPGRGICWRLRRGSSLVLSTGTKRSSKQVSCFSGTGGTFRQSRVRTLYSIKGAVHVFFFFSKSLFLIGFSRFFSMLYIQILRFTLPIINNNVIKKNPKFWKIKKLINLT